MAGCNNLDNYLYDCNSKYINIKQDRAAYTNHFSKLRDTLFSKLRSDEVLKKLFNGFQLGGSYGDHLKVKKADEFDCVYHLLFPESDSIIVIRDPRRPGNVFLDMSKVLELIRAQKQHEAIYNKLMKLVTARNLLVEDKLQSWLGSLVTKALNEMQHRIVVDGVTSVLKYTRCGPAHTIHVSVPFKYSVDFVPAIKLKRSQNVLEPKQLKYMANIPNWEAIPKPLKPFEKDNISFRASYYEAEKKLLQDHNNLKSALKIMKKFRDTKMNMFNLKSYYIKTLFLWQVQEKPAKYWNGPLSEICIDMFGELEKCLRANNKLLFFWHPQLNLFASFDANQKSQMFNCVVGSSNILRKAAGNLTEDVVTKLLCSLSDREERGVSNKSSAEDKLNEKLRDKSVIIPKSNDKRIPAPKPLADIPSGGSGTAQAAGESKCIVA